jgi:hypothetical protein
VENRAPRGYLYTPGAFFLACIASGFFIYIRFQYGLSPIGRYHLLYYLRREMAGLTHPANAYRVLRITDGKSEGRLARDAMSSQGPCCNLMARHCH